MLAAAVAEAEETPSVLMLRALCERKLPKTRLGFRQFVRSVGLGSAGVQRVVRGAFTRLNNV